MAFHSSPSNFSIIVSHKSHLFSQEPLNTEELMIMIDQTSPDFIQPGNFNIKGGNTIQCSSRQAFGFVILFALYRKTTFVI